MSEQKSNFCFCTFASGSTYRTLAKNLVSDIKQYSPQIPLIIFTDKFSEFINDSDGNLLIFEHKKQGVFAYHERRFAIAKSLSMFDSCMYLDADVRLCAPVPQNRQWIPGITARSCTNMTKHFQGRINKTNSSSVVAAREFEFFKQMACKLEVDIETEEITWVNEFLFVVTKDSGKELEFLNLWHKLALYAELNGHYKHPAYAIGLAAAKTGFPIRYDGMEGLDFFDDRIERIRISKGQSDPNTKRIYFETQNKIENPPRSISQKILKKLNHWLDYCYYSIRLKIKTILEDFEFYYK
ncbi:MAG: hypothetical protein ACREPR_20650 [Brasilonema sp.]